MAFEDFEKDPDVAVWPLLSFFYGLTPLELWEMPRGLVRHYLNELPRIRAEEQQLRCQAAAFPHMKKHDQQHMIRRLERMAAPRAPERPTSEIEYRAKTAAMGIGIKQG